MYGPRAQVGSVVGVSKQLRGGSGEASEKEWKCPEDCGKRQFIKKEKTPKNRSGLVS